MGWRMVKQPNGLLARFSDVVDTFTHVNLTAEEALEVCREEYELSEDAAKKKVRGGIEDWPPWTHNKPGTGHERWDDALASIQSNHGQIGVDYVIDLIKGGDDEDNSSIDITEKSAPESDSDDQVLVSREKLNELISVVRSINRGRQHEIKIAGESRPCYWQRSEWVDWGLEVCEDLAKDLKQPE